MLLVYTNRITNRLGYTLNLIFKDILAADYSITTDKDYFLNSQDNKLSYCETKIADELFIASSSLLFETAIETKSLDYFVYDSIDAIFPTYNNDSEFPFDIFAASFYFVSRYEEYLPFRQDEHGRFPANESFLYKHKLLLKPLVNIWANLLKKKLIERYPNIQFKERKFN